MTSRGRPRGYRPQGPGGRGPRGSGRRTLPLLALAAAAVAVVALMVCCSGSGQSVSSSAAGAEGEAVAVNAQQGEEEISDLAASSPENAEPAIEEPAVEDGSLGETPQLGDEAASQEARSIDGFAALSQYPELPNGCEVTSLAALLNHYGFAVDKTVLSDAYLPKGPVGEVSFYERFEGDPRDEDAYGCYAPVIVATADAYLSSVGSPMRASDVTGTPARELYHRHIDEGRPVIVWATRYLEQGHYSVTWHVDGQDLTWFTPEHCMVLVGYDEANRTVRLADPIVGEVCTYEMDLFESRYADLGQQAVVLE